ncbi:nitrogen regulation protein NR(II) [Maridesulfovibrio ferrireducens]|uniref:two-component system sensor histidine kinase NtrB n=1 Tax=Maridesulfovibrio ferrireducens TaxID=246191 RepID=UPI001A1DE7D0|nr:ATP-binding protein [Maridesulfovibrio ferrireducens]MBI9109602.1 PAS domain S-box protein [Maridesulfovibrio ferrireducens]
MAGETKLFLIAIKIASIYAAFGCLWILLSDKFLLLLVQDTDTVNSLQTYKGWFYVLVTALLVYGLIKKLLRSEQQSHKRYQRLLNNIADPIYLADSQGNILDVNNSACEKLGYTREEILGLKLNDIDADANLHEWSDFINTIKDDHSFSLESYHKRKDGSLFPIEISAYIFDEENNRYCLGVARDITIRKKTQDLLIQNEKMSSLGELAAGIAHEINNPLSAIMGASQNIYNRIYDDTGKNIATAEENSISLNDMRNYLNKRGVNRMLNFISVSGLKASKIVHNVLSFSRKTVRKLCICEISELLNETIELISNDYNLNNEFDFRQIKITREFEENIPQVCCLANDIQQVFMNVLKNATEAMAEKIYAKGTAPELILRISSKESKVTLEIEDNGPGMTEEIQNKIFEPFYTSKEVGKGTGLGLSISYFIITDLHHGQMSVTSVPEVGTLFTITLPSKTEERCS